MGLLEKTGDLSAVPLAAVLLDAFNARATGTLLFDAGGGASRLYLRAGVPVGAQSYAGFRPLGQELLAARLIDLPAFEKSLVEMSRTGRKQGDLLVEMGAVSREAVDAALSRQQSGYLAQVARLAEGTFRFEPGEPPEWTRGVRTSPLRAVVDALTAPQAASLVEAAFAQAGPQVAFRAGYAAVARAFGWTAEETTLVARLASPVEPSRFVAGGDLPPERARAVLAALVLLGLAGGDEARAAPPIELPEVIEITGEVEIPDATEEAFAPEAAPAAPPRPAPVAAPARPRPPDEAAEESRRRRARLLARALENMGARPPPGAPAPARHGPPPPPGAPAPAPHGPPAPPRREARVSPPAFPAGRDAGASDQFRAADPASRASFAATGEERQLRLDFELAESRAASADLFVRLGLEPAATVDGARRAFLDLARRFHPDLFATPGVRQLAPRVSAFFGAVNEAYQVLADPGRRAEYLARTSAGRPPDPYALVDFKKGDACVKTRDWVRARGFLESAVAADPRPEYQALLAFACLMDPARPDRARAAELSAAAMHDPSCDRAFYVAALLARDDGDEHGAERLFRGAVAANPRHLEAARELRLIALRRGQRPS
ncbi:DUF4388 domain-containing protein [Anaeromyxobacter paludicola]|uniref:J domain-containing protein n=1 Tax=Anaeromyxobacter paludicola TaxID=2918171 RepID=A0ABN6NED6_9BACT|nr:DUF4388 domain-containing protein [Anaeromyxobacter paludicola]BDG10378.1 hypothetical protein AMPC_34910 [Anaeromyxobacter paludicola]